MATSDSATDEPSLRRRITWDFAVAAGVVGCVAGALGFALLFLSSGTSSAGAALLTVVTFGIIGLGVGSSTGFLLGFVYDRARTSPVLWVLGFLVAVPVSLLPAFLYADGDSVRMVWTALVFLAFIGPPAGLGWALWLLLHRRGRRPLGALTLLGVTLFVVEASIAVGVLGFALQTAGVSSSPTPSSRAPSRAPAPPKP